MHREIDAVTAKCISLGGYKRIGKRISFADIAVKKSLEHNRSVKMMERINTTVTWENIEALLLEYYDACPVE